MCFSDGVLVKAVEISSGVLPNALASMLDLLCNWLGSYSSIFLSVSTQLTLQLTLPKNSVFCFIILAGSKNA